MGKGILVSTTCPDGFCMMTHSTCKLRGGAAVHEPLTCAPHNGAGNQATMQYQQTVTYFRPLWKQLRQKAVPPGEWLPGCT